MRITLARHAIEDNNEEGEATENSANVGVAQLET